ncbi:DNA replication ATP-dependent helicase-like protein [Aphelenchoides besseyi]|nr:DNA replication ATP-dependent helicase-like protein [Aphelenchoides besseyi]
MAGRLSEFDIEELPNIEKSFRHCEQCEQLSNCALVEQLSINSSLPDPTSDSAYELHNLMNKTAEHLTEIELDYARQWIKWTLIEWKTDFHDLTSPTTTQNQTTNSTNRDDSFYTNGLTLQNISTLMANTDEARRFRSLLIERRPPKFIPEIKLAKTVQEFLRYLDRSQRADFDHCIAAEDYAIIQRLPGAGKTTMIAALVASLVRMGKSVLLAAHTHSAVDNMITKLYQVSQSQKPIHRFAPSVFSNLPIHCCAFQLVPNHKILRLGAAELLHPTVAKYGLDAKLAALRDWTLPQKMEHLQTILFSSVCILTH